MAALQYLESLRNEHPELADWYSSLADLYQKKLWHQLTLKLEQFVALTVFQAGDALIQLYHNFITDFETKINLLKLAHFAVIVSRQYSDKEASTSYLEGVIEKLQATKEQRIEEPIIYIKMQIAKFKLEQGDQKECKKLLDDGKSTLDSMTDIDPSVYASYYWVSSQYHKFRQEFADFYRSALLYLAYTSVASLSESFKLDLAFDLSLSALLGDNIYNFGELLAHPIITSLLGTRVEWLYHILQAFNSGDLARYQELCHVHNAALRAQPALVENEKKLSEKINILCLMEIIFSRPSEDRTIPLKVIAERTKLSIEDVEHLLMKSLSVSCILYKSSLSISFSYELLHHCMHLIAFMSTTTSYRMDYLYNLSFESQLQVHLIEGTIDQVEGTVHVSWVQPRVLGIPQIKSLRDRLDNWVGKVQTAWLSIEAETPDLVAA
ncbi:26S proteasome non-ATPase regulatory subunit 13 homolog A isoform X1 [Gossypium arboreum]|uniref:26S proteasome non-ATPase regulatory subunit 13 homolog A isoform X1 n=1 Tax=Gossypium arboreum TaxID=29729 RepID=UPI0022F16A3A|nr:26S proteasome non-ATPase regulatory subunit 13 homolog A isoform X1 [Gossypium arboreum]